MMFQMVCQTNCRVGFESKSRPASLYYPSFAPDLAAAGIHHSGPRMREKGIQMLSHFQPPSEHLEMTIKSLPVVVLLGYPH